MNYAQSKYRSFAYCFVQFAFKLLYTILQFHTIHHIICLIVHAYSSFMFRNFAFDFIMLGIAFYKSQPINLNLCIIVHANSSYHFIICYLSQYMYYLNIYLIIITQPIPTSAYPIMHLIICIL